MMIQVVRKSCVLNPTTAHFECFLKGIYQIQQESDLDFVDNQQKCAWRIGKARPIHSFANLFAAATHNNYYELDGQSQN